MYTIRFPKVLQIVAIAISVRPALAVGFNFAIVPIPMRKHIPSTFSCRPAGLLAIAEEFDTFFFGNFHWVFVVNFFIKFSHNNLLFKCHSWLHCKKSPLGYHPDCCAHVRQGKETISDSSTHHSENFKKISVAGVWSVFADGDISAWNRTLSLTAAKINTVSMGLAPCINSFGFETHVWAKCAWFRGLSLNGTESVHKRLQLTHWFRLSGSRRGRSSHHVTGSARLNK